METNPPLIHMVSVTAQITGRRGGKEFLGAVGLRSTGPWMLSSHPSPPPHPSSAEAPSHLYFPAGVSSLSVSLQLPIASRATSSGSPPSAHRACSYSPQGPRGPWSVPLGRQPHSGHCCVLQLEGGLEQQDQELLLFPAALPTRHS